MAASPPLEREYELQLVKRAQGGDRRALDELLRAHRDRIWGVCRRITGSDADAQDATQEASIAIMRHIAKFDGNSAFSTWIYRIATNASLDELRRRKRRAVTVGDDTMLESIGSHAPAGIAAFVDASSTGGFDTRIADRLQIDAALSRLPADFRAAVVLRDLCDLDYGEIAEVLGIPPGTVRSRIARGRAALGPILATKPDEDDAVVRRIAPVGARGMTDDTDPTGKTGNQIAAVTRLTSRTADSSDSSTS
jgi:RNA polymerase sigma-70 factor, ECF subfamily